MDRTNESATGYTYGGQQYTKQTRTDSQGNTYTVDVPTAISTAQLSQAQPLQLPTQPASPNYPGVISNAVGQVGQSSLAAQAQADALAQQEAQNQGSALSNLMAQTQAQVGNKASDVQSLYQSSGVNDLAAQLRKLNAQAQGLQLEAQAIPLQEQNLATGQNITTAAVQRNATDRLRDNAIKALSIAQQSAVAQADYATAKDLADQQIAIKYDALENDLKVKQLQLQALDKYVLTLAQEKAKESRALALKREEQDLADKKANEKAVNTLMVNAQQQGVPSSVYEKAKAIQARGGSETEVAAALGVYSGDYLSTQIKKAQLAKLGLENKKAYDELYSNPGKLEYLSFEDNQRFNSTPEAKAVKDATSYAKAISDYKAAIEKYGTGEVFGKGSGALGQAYSALVGATKDYYTLGTLDNGVQKLIALGIPEPSVWGLKGGRIDALDTALNAASDTIKRNTDQLLSTKYKNTNELKQLVDNAGGVLMYRMTNQDLLNSIPSSSGANTTVSGSTNSNFFNK